MVKIDFNFKIFQKMLRLICNKVPLIQNCRLISFIKAGEVEKTIYENKKKRNEIINNFQKELKECPIDAFFSESEIEEINNRVLVNYGVCNFTIYRLNVEEKKTIYFFESSDIFCDLLYDKINFYNLFGAPLNHKEKMDEIKDIGARTLCEMILERFKELYGKNINYYHFPGFVTFIYEVNNSK